MDFGSKIREIRKSRGLTIKEVAASSGIAFSLISNIENNKANPSLTTISSLAQALGVTISDLFSAGPVEQSPLVRSAERVMFRDFEGMKSYMLCNSQYESFEAHLTVLPLDATTEHYPELHSAKSCKYEFAYLLSGKLEVIIDGISYVLYAGDCICINSESDHSVGNLAKTNSEILWVMVR